MWKHKSETGYNNTHAVEKVIDTLEQSPKVPELKGENEKKYFYLIVLNKVQEQ